MTIERRHAALALLAWVSACGGRHLAHLSADAGATPDAGQVTAPSVPTAACPPVEPPTGWFLSRGRASLELDPSRPSRAYRVTDGALEIVTPGSRGACAVPAVSDVAQVDVSTGARGAVYLLTAHGQVRRSLDGGVTWSAPTETGIAITSSSVGDELTAEPFGDDRVAIVETGRDGFLLSVDGGATFKPLAPVEGPNIPARPVMLPQHGLVVFAYDRNTDQVVVAHSTDDGATWSRHGWALPYAVDSTTVLPNGTIVGVTAGGLVLSSDAGDTWSTSVPGHVTALAAGGDALTIAGDSGSGSVIERSRDAGMTWSPLGTIPDVVHRLDVSRDGETMLAQTDSGVLASRDAGRTWTLAQPWVATGTTLTAGGTPGELALPLGRRLALSRDGGATWSLGEPVAHDLTRVVLHPTRAGLVTANTAAGLMRSTDGGAMWRPWTIDVPPRPGSDGLHIPLVGGVWQLDTYDSLSISPTQPDVMFAAVLMGDVVRSRDGGGTWTRILTGGADPTAPSGFDVVAVAPSNAATVYALASGGQVLYASDDGGDHWRTAPLSAGFYGALAVHPADPAIVVVGTFDGVLVSTDGGRTLPPRLLDRDETFEGDLTVLAFEPWGAHRLYVADGSHRLSRSTPDLASFTHVTAPTLVRWLAFDAARPGHVLALQTSLTDDQALLWPLLHPTVDARAGIFESFGD